ncbi:helix-turn-helix domain-containing protein [Promicromonospora thailandica]|uniref:Helix-turn-helix domain-containing protein n=1 Tax=Promicromonospora thailandica TaxID=765201 RepID=A0A9X2G258_9MICO|nr:helix-turn-helix transcriptional regulator [Promicromonospora thailandica]MCP2263922.1 Helix-turn-helix domain-containing protein [Promicromonospora thailandica]BFF17763.1 helix-turn-helix transcriptional regulator [Promicromonospora thailandica]
MHSRTGLGTALRAWRATIGPADVGLPVVGRRRSPGLRREELALLAGISFDYLVQLEQGRATRPSAGVLQALADVLHLSTVDREVLYRLAGSVVPPSGSVPSEVPAGVQRMIDRMTDTPVAVFTATWDAVQWNPLWGQLFGTPSDLVSGPGDALARNMIWGHFSAETPAGVSGVERDTAHTDAFERMMVSDLRRAADRYPDDRAVTELIDGLRAAPRFDELWARYETLPLAGSHKTIVHPELGSITVDCDILAVEHADLHIVMNWAVPGTRDAEKIDALREQAATAAR